MFSKIYRESIFHTSKIIGKYHSRETTIKSLGKSLIVTGKFVNVIGEPYNLVRENL